MFDSIFKRSKKEVIAENRRKGAVAEKSYKFRAAIAGYETERTGRGHDFKLYKKMPFHKKELL